jgi:subtilisin-like proprotein convertase family protein
MHTRRIAFVAACLLAVPLARAELTFTTHPSLPITDGNYAGTLASMSCASVVVSGTGSYLVDSVTVTAGIDHTWIGDLVLKLVSPDMQVVTLMSRPGVTEFADDGTSSSGFGDSSNLVSTSPVQFVDAGPKSAESMGDALSDSQAACRDDGACVYDPNRGAAPGGKLIAFNGHVAAGTWKFCAGDSTTGDTGTIQQVGLTFPNATPAVLKITPKMLDFGAVVQGASSAVRFVTLSNEGTTQLTINSLTNALPPFQRTTDGTCGNSLPLVLPYIGQCTLSYIFSPAAQDVVSQSFSVASTASGDTGFDLRGSGDAIFVEGFEP